VFLAGKQGVVDQVVTLRGQQLTDPTASHRCASDHADERLNKAGMWTSLYDQLDYADPVCMRAAGNSAVAFGYQVEVGQLWALRLWRPPGTGAVMPTHTCGAGLCCPP
jgi:hypothetical protein